MLRYSVTGNNWTFKPLIRPHRVEEILSVDTWKIEVVEVDHNLINPIVIEVESFDVYLEALSS
jgi:hypothetical protein